MAPHLDAALSAYVDLALSPEERAAVDAHLSGCDACRAELEELRSVRRLLAALPERAPSRSLLPRRSTLPGWLLPARWASSAAAVVFAFAFVVSSVPSAAQFGPTGGVPAQPAAAPAPQRDSEESAKFSTQAPRLAASPSPTAGPTSAGEGSAPGADTALRTTHVPRGSASGDRPIELLGRQPSSSPLSWLWLAGAVIAGLTALGLQWRIARRR